MVQLQVSRRSYRAHFRQEFLDAESLQHCKGADMHQQLGSAPSASLVQSQQMHACAVCKAGQDELN